MKDLSNKEKLYNEYLKEMCEEIPVLISGYDNSNESLFCHKLIFKGKRVILEDSFYHFSIGTLFLDFINTDLNTFDDFLSFFMKYGPFGYGNKLFFNTRNQYQNFINKLLLDNENKEIFKNIVNEFYTTNKSHLQDFQNKLLTLAIFTYNLNDDPKYKDLKPLERNYILSSNKYVYYNIDVNLHFGPRAILNNKSIPNNKSTESLISDFKNKKLSVTSYYDYESQDIFSLMLISFTQILNNEKFIIKICKNCGKYFIPAVKSNEIFCNNLYNDTNKTCKEVGSSILYNAKLKQDEAQRKYRSSYSNWSMLIKRYPDIEVYKTNFEQWKKDTNKFKSDIKNGLATNEEFLEWLETHKGGYSYGR